MHGRLTVIIGPVDISGRSLRVQPLDERQVAVIACDKDRVPSPLVCLTDVAARAHADQPSTDIDVTLPANHMHRRVLAVVGCSNITACTHAEEPLADIQVAIAARLEHGCLAIAIRSTDVVLRAGRVEPLRHGKVAAMAGHQHGCVGAHRVGPRDVLSCAILEEPSTHVEPTVLACARHRAPRHLPVDHDLAGHVIALEALLREPGSSGGVVHTTDRRVVPRI